MKNTQAYKFASRNEADVVRILNASEHAEQVVEINQDWEAGCSIIVFEDNSTLEICGTDVVVCYGPFKKDMSNSNKLSLSELTNIS